MEFYHQCFFLKENGPCLHKRLFRKYIKDKYNYTVKFESVPTEHDLPRVSKKDKIFGVGFPAENKNDIVLKQDDKKKIITLYGVGGVKAPKDCSYLFYYADVNVDPKNFDTSETEDMSYMFSRVIKNKINFENLNTSNVKNMQGMFMFSAIEKMDLSSFDTSKVEDMSIMFFGMQGYLLDVSSFDTSNVVDMNNMFGNISCRDLDLSNFNTSKVKNMERMFVHSFINDSVVSGFDTSNVMNMNEMFAGADIDEALDLSSFNLSSINVLKDPLKFLHPYDAVVYCRSSEEIEIFKEAESEENKLRFMIKP